MSDPEARHDPVTMTALTATYGKNQVLHGLDLTVKQGEIFGLIGLNGAGKTTLIKVLLDLMPAASGSAHLFTLPVREPQARAELAYLPERFQPTRSLTGQDFLSLSAHLDGYRLDQAQVESVLGQLDLDCAVLKSRIRSYSKGMAQKIGLAAAFLSRKKLMILDEPMSGLDPKARIGVKTLMRQARSEGRTIFLSSHILADLDEICDRIGVLHEGHLRCVETPENLKSRHREISLECAFLAEIGAFQDSDF